uniref:Uncharacterized protein n=1 Tax=Fagus sylvatica TaxID=28930 RepID=A0A2N9FZE0_FAGSY
MVEDRQRHRQRHGLRQAYPTQSACFLLSLYCGCRIW